MMKKIRIGNDFTLNWEITRGGLAEDLSSALDAKLTMTVYRNKIDIPFTTNGNIVHIEFTPDICNIMGAYNLQLYYILPDTTLSDEDRKCTIDIDAFQIVPKSAMADDSSEFSVTSDMAVGFQGKSAYEVWLETHEGTEEDYLAWLQQPATNAAATANSAAELANTKAGEANDAAEAANEARLNIQTDLAKKAEHGYTENPKTLKQVDDAEIQLTTDINSDEEVVATDLNALSERLNALETAFRNMTLTKVQTDTLDVLVNLNFQGRPLFVIGTTAPGIPPDGVPQFYINTANGDLYSAQNSNSVSDWKLK